MLIIYHILVVILDFWQPSWILGMTLTLQCLNSHRIGFTMSKTIEIDTKIVFLSLLVQKVWTLQYFTLIGGDHLGFDP